MADLNGPDSKAVTPPDPATEYKQKLDAAFRTHVATSIRKEDSSIPADATDDEVLGSDYALTKQQVPDMTDDEYSKALETQFRPTFVAPKKDLRVRASEVENALTGVIKGIGRGLKESFTSPVTAGHEFGVSAQQKKMAADLRADTSGTPEEQAARKAYADQLEQVAGESAKKGALATGEGVATYATLPLGGGLAKGAVEQGAKVLLGKEAGELVAGQIAKRVGTGLVGQVAKHAAEGAAFGGTYGVVKGGVSAGLEAAQQGQGAGQVFGAITHGAAHEGTVNAVAGAAIGGVLGPVLEAGGAATVGRKSAQEAAQQQATRAAAALAFKEQFHPSFIGERFTADVAQAAQEGVSDNVLAQRIVGKLTNVAPEQADQALTDIMVGKLAQYRQGIVAAEGIGAKLYPEAALPPAERAGEVLPLSTDLEPAGGPAPPEAELPGLAPTQPEAPGAAVPFSPPEGFEQAPGPPEATAPGMPMQGVAPEESPLSPMPLRQPMDINNAAPAPSPNAPAIEPRPFEPAPRPAAPGNDIQPRPLNNPTVQPSAATVMGQAEKTPEQGAKPVSPETPTKSPADASFHMNGLGVPTGQPGWQAIGDVAYRTSATEDGKAVELNYIENLGGEKGAGAAVLKKLTKVADEHQTPMELVALPLPRGNGKGRIPLDKLVEFYKRHGFTVTEEGDGWASMRREPVPAEKATPELVKNLKEQGDAIADRIDGLTDDRAKVAAGNVTEGSVLIKGKSAEGRPTLTFGSRLEGTLTRIGKEADARLKQRLTGPQALGAGAGAVDPSALKDLAISAAAKMFVLGIRSTRKVGEALMAAHGDWVKPHLDKVIDSGKKLLMRLISSDRPTGQQMREIQRMFQQGKVGMDWYDKTWGWLQQHFGDDAEMMARFVSATSFGNSTEGNATQALKAFAQWKLGLPFDGHLSKTQALALLKATRGEVFGDGKAQGYLGALTGDPNAIALDRHVMRTLGFTNAGKASGRSALSNSTYRLYSTILRDLAKEAGVTPRQYQAALWAAPKIEGIQAEHAAGSIQHRTGSFRPMEQLLEPRLNGLTPNEWVEQNKVTYQNLANASEGVLRARSDGGHSFNVDDFTPFQKPGYIVTLDSRRAPIGEVSGTQVVKFAKRYRDLTDRFHGTLVGVYQSDKFPGQMSMDFNIHMPDHPGNEELAKRLGLQGRQLAVGHIDQNGTYRDIATGYDPETHGPQFEQRPIAEIEQQLRDIGQPSKDDPKQLSLFTAAVQSPQGRLAFDPSVHAMAVAEPAFALTHYANASGKSAQELKNMINSGQFKPMTDAGVNGAVFVGKDGIVHQYVDPVAPSYNTTRVFGSLRGKNLVQTLDKLKGMEILRGHDVVESFRSQAGFARLSAPPPAPDEELSKTLSKMTQTQGQVVPLAAAMKGSRETAGSMNSFWLFPNGRLVRSTMTHAGHARAMKVPGVRGYAGTDGSAGASVQRLLNMGIVRVQAAGSAAGFDFTGSLTDAQRSALQKIAFGRDSWAAQATDAKGKLIAYKSSADGEFRHVIDELSK